MSALGDELLVRRASRRFALQAAALVASTMLLLIGIVTVVVVRGQQTATDTLLRTTAATADDVVDPPSGGWIVISRYAHVVASPGLPAVVSTRLATLRNTRRSGPELQTLGTDDGHSYRVVTGAGSVQVVQVVLDLKPQQQERERLLQAMGVAALMSLLVAGGLGALLGRRGVRPLAQALSLQRTFVADASHELRTPLTLLSTRMQVLDGELTRTSQDEDILTDSRGVVADIQRLGEVVEDLLVAVDPRQGAPVEPLDLAELVADVVTSATAHATAVEVTLSITHAPGKAALTVRGSKIALRRAVLALVDNAIDHTPMGGLVDITLRTHRNSVVVAVCDAGPGIAPEATEHLLQRFHSGGQRAGRTHYGLGLALTHDVANRHGGQLRLVPTPAGTTFELVLPACQA